MDRNYVLKARDRNEYELWVHTFWGIKPVEPVVLAKDVLVGDLAGFSSHCVPPFAP